MLVATRRRIFGALVALLVLASLQTPPASAQNELSWDFENGDLSDWNKSGQVEVVGAGSDEQTDQAMEQVAEGSQSLRVGDAIPWGQGGAQFSSIERSVIVPADDGNPMLQFSYAVVANDPAGHPEQEKPFFSISIQDLTTGETLQGGNFLYSDRTSADWFLGVGPGDAGALSRSFSRISGDRWVYVPWRHEQIDLGDRIGHEIRFTFTLRDCIPNAHAAYGYLDNIRVGAETEPPPLPALLKTPVPAGAPPETTLIQSFMTVLERYALWPWCLLAPLALAALWLFLRRRRGPVTPPDDDVPPARRPRATPAPPPDATGHDSVRK